jgi:hypothetical protein
LANEASWITFAILTHNFWIAAPGIVNTPLAVFMLVVIGRSRRRLAELSARQCSRCRFERGEHVIFTTTPTGYGTVAECSPATVKDGIPVPRDLVAPAHTVTFAAQ